MELVIDICVEKSYFWRRIDGCANGMEGLKQCEQRLNFPVICPSFFRLSVYGPSWKFHVILALITIEFVCKEDA